VSRSAESGETMATETQVEERNLSGKDAAARWRFEELLRAGYEIDDATALALRADVDLHWAVELVRGGCPSATARRIAL